MNSFSFYLGEKPFLSPSVLSDNLAGQSILGCRFSPFGTLNISCHSLLAYKVSTEKSADSFMELPLYVTLFLLWLLEFSLTFDILIMICLVVGVFGFIFFGTLCFLYLDIYLLQVRKFSVIISSNIFSTPFTLSSPSGTPIMQILVCLMSQRSLKLFSTFKICFSFCCSDRVISVVLSSRLL